MNEFRDKNAKRGGASDPFSRTLATVKKSKIRFRYDNIHDSFRLEIPNVFPFTLKIRVTRLAAQNLANWITEITRMIPNESSKETNVARKSRSNRTVSQGEASPQSTSQTRGHGEGTK